MIEEIAELLKNTYYSTPWYDRSWHKIAKTVYEKLHPEGSVVLSKEEYERFQRIETNTAKEIYAIIDKKCDPNFSIFDGRLYFVGYQMALKDIKKCLEEHYRIGNNNESQYSN